jgi:hypothetical protein
MNFGDILNKAWKTVWNNKVLWIFGFFASLMAYNSSGGGGNNVTWRQDINMAPGNMPHFLQNFGWRMNNFVDQISTGTWIALGVGMVLLAIVFFLVSVFFGHLGRAALIRGTVMSEEGTRLTFGGLFKEGLRYFWHLLALSLLLLAGIIAAALVVVLFSVFTLGIGAILFACLALPIIIGVSLMVMQTTIFIVAEDEKIFDAIAHAWRFIFYDHLGNYLIMGVILFLLGLIASFVIAIPALIAGIPAVIAIVAGQNIFSALGVALTVIFLLIYIPFYIAAQGLLTSFTWSAWVHFYRELRGLEADAVELDKLLEDGDALPAPGDMN